jgi:hypothetical protein
VNEYEERVRVTGFTVSSRWCWSYSRPVLAISAEGLVDVTAARALPTHSARPPTSIVLLPLTSGVDELPRYCQPRS